MFSSARGLQGAATVAALGVSLAGAALPARADGPSGSTAAAPTAPQRDVLALGSSSPVGNPETTTVQPRPSALVHASFDRTAPTLAESSLPTRQNLLMVLGTACSAGAMGWYYLQLRRRETAASLTTLVLQTGNDGLLAAAALMTGQGFGPAAMLLGFTVVGALCAREVWKQSRGAITISRLDGACGVACVLGWAALGAGLLPWTKSVLGAEPLAFAGSIIGTAINTISALPLMKNLLTRPGPTEAKSTKESPLRAVLKPVLPFVLGTAAMACALGTVTKTTTEALTQPIALLLNNLLLTGMVALWAARRVR